MGLRGKSTALQMDTVVRLMRKLTFIAIAFRRDYPNLALLFWRLTGNLKVDEEILPNNEYHANCVEARLCAMCNRIASHP